MRECAWCTTRFEPTVTYQIYCSIGCREESTAHKKLENARRNSIKRRLKKKRMCANGCGTLLSVYNSSKICYRCKVNDTLVQQALDNIKDFFEVDSDDQ